LLDNCELMQSYKLIAKVFKPSTVVKRVQKLATGNLNKLETFKIWYLKIENSQFRFVMIKGSYRFILLSNKK